MFIQYQSKVIFNVFQMSLMLIIRMISEGSHDTENDAENSASHQK